MRLHTGEELDALVDERFGRVAPRIVLAAVAARWHHGADPLVERGREQRLLTVPGMAGETDLGLVHLRQGDQIVNRARCRPGPSGQAGPVVLGIDLDPGVRVVAVAVVRVGGVIDRRDVAATHRRVDPWTVARMVREEDGEGPLAVGDHQLDAQARALGRPELEPDLADRRAAFAVSGGHGAAQIVGRGRHRAEDPVLYLRAQGALLSRPYGRRRDGDSPAVLAQHQRIGQIGDRRHRVEVRGQLSGPPQPVLPSTIVRVHPPRCRGAAGLKQLQELVASPSLRVRSGLRLHERGRQAERAQQSYR